MAIKRITPENWLERDGDQFAAIEFTSLNDANTRLMDGEDWIRNFTEPELLSSVPDEVQNLFEVARGALCYGYFFYPLYTLGFEQLFRVGEAAITAKFRQMGGNPKKYGTFEKRVDFLMSQNVLTASHVATWTTIRRFRNLSSHPERQNIFPPGFVTGTLLLVVEAVNKLFRK